jgi:nucleoside-diphosphate-sugar epimerase
MAILVTGAHGYVGDEVLRVLDEAGSGTIVAEVDWFPEARVDEVRRDRPQLGDFRAIRLDDLAGIEAIIHLAAYSNDPLGSLAPDATDALNHTAAVALAGRAKLAGVRTFVQASTCSVYGASGATEVDESASCGPLTPYAAAKRSAEIGLQRHADERFRVAVVRGATAFGPSGCPRTDLLLNELCAEAVCGRPLVLRSDGMSWRPFMPVGDFARALVTAALAPPTGGGVSHLWNIAPPEMQMTTREAAERAAAVAGVAGPRLADSGPGVDARSYRVSGTLFPAAYPGFAYRHDFESCIAETIDAFARISTLDADLRADRFVRLASLGRQRSASA